jgi:3-oxoacyl-[acyl-carrier protein] reductase
MDLDLVGRRALVGGSSQGIGLAAAVELARLGASVTLLARNGEALAKACKGLPREHGQSHGMLAADFSRPEQVEQTIATWLGNGGGAEILVNNTGGPPPGPAQLAKAEEFLAAFRNHLIVNQLLVQMLLPTMQAARFGRIINVISTSVKQPIRGLGVSNTIRGAVASWAKTLANELAPLGITVNNVLPGATRTGRLESIIDNDARRQGKSEDEIASHMLQSIPAGRFAEPAEIGAAIAFLASPAAGYITGINLPVDGGRTQCL